MTCPFKKKGRREKYDAMMTYTMSDNFNHDERYEDYIGCKLINDDVWNSDCVGEDICPIVKK